MARSPIEMMVDKACGFDPDAPRADLKRKAVAVDADTQALMDVGDAAVLWVRQRDADSERALIEAAKALDAKGWL